MQNGQSSSKSFVRHAVASKSQAPVVVGLGKQVGSSGSQSVQQAGQAAKRTARQAAGRPQDLYGTNPLVGGMLAAAVGAALGSTIPISRNEQDALADIGSDARDLLYEQKDQLTTNAMEKKDELLDKADEKLQSPSGSQADEPDRARGRDAGPPGSDQTAGSERRPSFPKRHVDKVGSGENRSQSSFR